ncbi:MAG TPA: ArgR family transcriptional regulator [Thermoanaerobaculia bacterium]|nr:ArgR family transcriptional regulator [Thermoanaerobaculia bacterium]
MTTTTPSVRRDEILRLVRQQPIHSQEELLELLRRKGLAVTQPTLSRDLRELGLVKTAGGYADPSSLGGTLSAPLAFIPPDVREAKLDAVIRESVLSAAAAGTVVVIKTPAAGAQPVARVVDEAGLPGVVGTLGGDDTIFVATSSTRAATSLVRRIDSLVAAPAPRRRRRA